MKPISFLILYALFLGLLIFGLYFLWERIKPTATPLAIQLERPLGVGDDLTYEEKIELRVLVNKKKNNQPFTNEEFKRYIRLYNRYDKNKIFDSPEEIVEKIKDKADQKLIEEGIPKDNTINNY